MFEENMMHPPWNTGFAGGQSDQSTSDARRLRSLSQLAASIKLRRNSSLNGSGSSETISATNSSDRTVASMYDNAQPLKPNHLSPHLYPRKTAIPRSVTLTSLHQQQAKSTFRQSRVLSSYTSSDLSSQPPPTQDGCFDAKRPFNKSRDSITAWRQRHASGQFTFDNSLSRRQLERALQAGVPSISHAQQGSGQSAKDEFSTPSETPGQKIHPVQPTRYRRTSQIQLAIPKFEANIERTITPPSKHLHNEERSQTSPNNGQTSLRKNTPVRSYPIIHHQLLSAIPPDPSSDSVARSADLSAKPYSISAEEKDEGYAEWSKPHRIFEDPLYPSEVSQPGISDSNMETYHLMPTSCEIACHLGARRKTKTKYQNSTSRPETSTKQSPHRTGQAGSSH